MWPGAKPRTSAESARDAGSQVAQTATDQARQVVAETGRQARDLVGEAQGQARDQASVQQQKAAQQLHSVADELHEMAAKGGQSGLATEVARQAADRLKGAASWLDQREPGDLLQGVRDFARRRPGTFLVGAAVAGLAAGRLTRGLTSQGGPDQQQGPRQGTVSGVPAASPVETAYPGEPAYAGPAEPTYPGPAEQAYAGPASRLTRSLARRTPPIRPSRPIPPRLLPPRLLIRRTPPIRRTLPSGPSPLTPRTLPTRLNRPPRRPTGRAPTQAQPAG